MCLVNVPKVEALVVVIVVWGANKDPKDKEKYNIYKKKFRNNLERCSDISGH